MATVINQPEIAVDDIQTKDLSYILPELNERRASRIQLMKEATLGSRCPKLKLKPLVKYLIICLLVLAAVIAYSVTQMNQESTLESLVSASSAKQLDDNAGYEMKLELGSNQLYQHCKGSYLKQTFPDVGYALFGYNILKGLPLIAGHDPGFTYPIFKADYSSGLLSADCRFFVPDGLVLAPDISCVISLSSTTVQTAYEYSKALGVYVTLEGEYSRAPVKAVKGVSGVKGGKKGVGSSPWGISFSASSGYRQASSAMTSGQSVFIFSTAKCNYYFSKLVQEKAPKFDDAFITWVYKLDKADSSPEVYFNFFNTYGTHFPTEVSFGARYTLEHKMTSKYYENLRFRNIDVGLTASYAGKFSLTGELSLSDTQKNIVSEFSESVQTRIIPVGATPPGSGNAITWASEVKENPIPTAYKLSSIESLFTDRYMKSLNVNYNKIHENIINLKLDYCLFLRNAGEVESCDNLVPGSLLENTKLTGHYRETAVSTISNCIDTCLQDTDCVAITFCISCLSKDAGYKTCYLFGEADEISSAIKTEEPDVVWQSNIFPGHMRKPYILHNVSLSGVSRVLENEIDNRSDMSKCKELCIMDAYCAAFSFRKSNDQKSKCKLYSKELLTGLLTELGVDSYFLPTRIDTFSTTTSPTHS